MRRVSESGAGGKEENLLRRTHLLQMLGTGTRRQILQDGQTMREMPTTTPYDDARSERSRGNPTSRATDGADGVGVTSRNRSSQHLRDRRRGGGVAPRHADLR